MKWEYDLITLQIKSIEHNKCWTTSNRVDKARIVLHPCNETSMIQKFNYDRGQIKPYGKQHVCVMAPLGKMLRLSPCNVDMFGTVEPLTLEPEPTTSLECPCDEKSQLPIAFCNIKNIEDRFETSCEAIRHNCGVTPPKFYVECSVLEQLNNLAGNT